MQVDSPTSSLRCILEFVINDLLWDFAADVCNFFSNLFIIVIKHMEQVTRKWNGKCCQRQFCVLLHFRLQLEDRRRSFSFSLRLVLSWKCYKNFLLHFLTETSCSGHKSSWWDSASSLPEKKARTAQTSSTNLTNFKRFIMSQQSVKKSGRH